eukprot:7036003-Alexandrium_andersonii.AAC.1
MSTRARLRALYRVQNFFAELQRGARVARPGLSAMHRLPWSKRMLKTTTTACRYGHLSAHSA